MSWVLLRATYIETSKVNGIRSVKPQNIGLLLHVLLNLVKNMGRIYCTVEQCFESALIGAVEGFYLIREGCLGNLNPDLHHKDIFFLHIRIVLHHSQHFEPHHTVKQEGKNNC